MTAPLQVAVVEEEFASHWEVLKGMLAAAPRKLNRKAIHRSWRVAPKPDMRSLYNWLERAFALGLVKRDRAGRRRRPFRYWLAEREAVWLEDPFALLHMPELVEEYTRGVGMTGGRTTGVD